MSKILGEGEENMYSNIKVNQGIITMYFGINNDAILAGSTLKTCPVATVVKQLSIPVPVDDGLHAIAVFEYNQEDSCLILGWKENNKTVLKSDVDLSITELSKFNPFLRSKVDILVSNTDLKIVYLFNPSRLKNTDPTWTYRPVSMNLILQYITKRITMEELDKQATPKQEKRDELSELHGQIGLLRQELEGKRKIEETMDSMCKVVKGLNETIADLLRAIKILKTDLLDNFCPELNTGLFPFITKTKVRRRIVTAFTQSNTTTPSKT